MTINISQRWHARCTECGWSDECAIEGNLMSDVRDHEDDHARWRAVGRSLAGRVFDAATVDSAWYGIVWEAEKAATEAGFQYLEWNGWIYPVGQFGEQSRLCMADDVPQVASR